MQLKKFDSFVLNQLLWPKLVQFPSFDLSQSTSTTVTSTYSIPFCSSKPIQSYSVGLN